MHQSICNHAKNDRFPDNVFYLCSNGQRTPPEPSTPMFLIVDENIQQRITREDLPPHFTELKSWLWSTGIYLSVTNTSVALEHSHSAHGAIHEFETYLKDINHRIQPRLLDGVEFIYRGKEPPPDPLELETAQVLVALTEIAWAKEVLRLGKLTKTNAKQNCRDFFAWRKEAFPYVEVTTATLIVWGVLAGNAQAFDCLKLGKKKEKKKEDEGKLLRNAAFDTLHLHTFLNNGSLGLTLTPPRLSVFITGDEALASFISSHKFYFAKGEAHQSIDFEKPWLEKEEELRSIVTIVQRCINEAIHHIPEQLYKLAVDALTDMGVHALPKVEGLLKAFESIKSKNIALKFAAMDAQVALAKKNPYTGFKTYPSISYEWKPRNARVNF